jgi:hypothetical protein
MEDGRTRGPAVGYCGLPLIEQKTLDEWGTVSLPTVRPKWDNCVTNHFVFFLRGRSFIHGKSLDCGGSELFGVWAASAWQHAGYATG